MIRKFPTTDNYSPEPEDVLNEVLDEEGFVPDDRAWLRPSEVVQSKLLSLMPETAVPVSCLHTRRFTRR